MTNKNKQIGGEHYKNAALNLMDRRLIQGAIVNET